MKRVRRQPKFILALIALSVLSAASASSILAAQQTTIIRAGNLVLHAGVSMSPQTLSKTTMTPISVTSSGLVETADGAHVPPAQTLNLQVDKHFRVESAGLPTCTAGRIEASSPAQAMKACGSALVGKGRVTGQVEFPESAPFNTKGPLLSSMARIRRGTRLSGYVFLHLRRRTGADCDRCNRKAHQGYR